MLCTRTLKVHLANRPGDKDQRQSQDALHEGVLPERLDRVEPSQQDGDEGDVGSLCDSRAHRVLWEIREASGNRRELATRADEAAADSKLGAVRARCWQLHSKCCSQRSGHPGLGPGCLGRLGPPADRRLADIGSSEGSVVRLPGGQVVETIGIPMSRTCGRGKDELWGLVWLTREPPPSALRMPRSGIKSGSATPDRDQHAKHRQCACVLVSVRKHDGELARPGKLTAPTIAVTVMKSENMPHSSGV